VGESAEVPKSCDERERLWQRWIDSCADVDTAIGEGTRKTARVREMGVRYILNKHLLSHGCGTPVAAPEKPDDGTGGKGGPGAH
jgi:hypothetical protein